MTIERQAVVHDCVGVRFLIASNRFIPAEHRREALSQTDTLQWCASFSAVLLHGLHSSVEKRCDVGVLLLVQHRHFGFASPVWLPF